MNQKKRVRRHGSELLLHRIGILLARKICKIVHANSAFGRYLIKDCLDTPHQGIHTNERRKLVYQRCYTLSFADDERTVLLIEPKFTPKSLADLYVESVATWSKWTAYDTKHDRLWDMLNTFCRPKLTMKQVVPIAGTVRNIVAPILDEKEVNDAIARMTQVLDDEKYRFKVSVREYSALRYYKKRGGVGV